MKRALALVPSLPEVGDELPADVVEALGAALGEALAAQFFAENVVNASDMAKSRSGSNRTDDDDMPRLF